MALVRAVDSLDLYIRLSNSKPFLLQGSKTRAAIDEAGSSVRCKFMTVEKNLRLPGVVVSALVALMISWRNRAAHAKADGKIPEKYREIIVQNLAELRTNFRGLDGHALLAGYDAERQPRFKEITSFINATHQYVRGMESALFQTLDARIVPEAACLEELKGARRQAKQQESAPMIARDT